MMLRRWELYRTWPGMSPGERGNPTGMRFWTERGARSQAQLLSSVLTDGSRVVAYRVDV